MGERVLRRPFFARMKNPSARWAPGQALAALEAHLRQRPDDVEALTDVAILLEATGRAPQTALARYDEALRLDPGHFRARLNRAVLMAALGRLEEALQDNLQLTKRYVGSWAAFYNPVSYTHLTLPTSDLV